MSTPATIRILLYILLMLAAMPALAQTGKHLPARRKFESASAGTCQLGVASVDLDINNVRARLYNTGGLFYRGGGPVYIVPKTGTGNALYAAGLWITGRVDGELAMTAADYGLWEFWPGPLDERGNPPDDCTRFDRMYKVSRQDILDYEDTGVAARDLADWPVELGAPVIDGDGIPDNYDLTAGDRPDILGDQTVWWVMNDKASVHQWSEGARPIGIEVHVTAFAFKRADALNNTTFYRYELLNKGGSPVTDTYFSIWVDPDLGNAGDDFVGSDTALGIGYVFNGDDFDDGVNGYGDRPPAVGVDFFQGPLADPDGDPLSMTSFVYYNSEDSQGGKTPQTDPYGVEEVRQYQRAIWRDKTPITYGGTGYGFSETPTSFMFAGEPGEFWSEDNTDNEGGRNDPGDRRFLMTAGPFTIEPGVPQTITFGIVWAQGKDRLDSVRKMKEDDKLAQSAFDIGFRLPPPPDAPRVDVSELDETVILSWGYRPSDNNYLDEYDVENPFLVDLDLDDNTYSLEGYIVHQFESEVDEIGEVVTTFDVRNGVTRVFDVVEIDDVTGTEVEAMTVDGTDNGLQHSIQFDDLTNYSNYYFGVQAYAYNEYSTPRIVKSAISRVTVLPSKSLARDGGTLVDLDLAGVDLLAESIGGLSDGSAYATIVDPSRITGHEYQVQFYTYTDSSDTDNPVTFATYDIVDMATGVVKVDGTVYADANGVGMKQVVPVPGVEPEGVVVVDGLDIKVLGPPEDFKEFLVVSNGAGPIDPPTGGAADFGGFPVPERPDSDQQVGEGVWLFHTSDDGERGQYQAFLNRTTRNGANWPNILPRDFEMRFTYDDDNWGYFGYTFFDGCEGLVRVPFELWDIGAGTPNDPSDDHRLFPFILDFDGGCEYGLHNTDHTVSSREDDPFTDLTYWLEVAETSPGERGYQEQLAAFQADLADDRTTFEVMARTVLVNWNGGDVNTGDYDQDLPERGTTFRIITNKVNGPGTLFSLDSSEFGVITQDRTAASQALDLIAVVPNPYKGTSDFEISNRDDVVRFTNMPEQATIRVFTLAGTLVKTIAKSSPNTWIEWDLTTDENLPIGSGMYIVHIEASGLGEKVIKFGVVKKKTDVTLF